MHTPMYTKVNKKPPAHHEGWMDGWMNDGYTREYFFFLNHFFIEFQFPTQPWWLA